MVSERGMTLVLLIADTEREQRTRRYVRAATSTASCSSPRTSPTICSLAGAAGVPTVCSGIPLCRAVAHVAIDEVGSARTMTRHLMDGGHRRIALITGPLDTPSGRFRLDGFRDELGDRFDETSSKWCLHRGAEAMARLLERAPDIDAVFAASDLLAVGAPRRSARRATHSSGRRARGLRRLGLAETRRR
jgi:DNA-binding LacI/PurR family transcriptional regulator